MRLTSVALEGAYLVEIEPIFDERGFFARSWCAEEFGRSGLNPALAQCGISFNARKGTLRGMHFQREPYAETKLVRCCSGAIYDVILDLRPSSASYCKWFAVELNATNHKMIYVPEGCAHGFQTLVDNTEVFYQMSPGQHAESAGGVRWDDPLFAIRWPIPAPILSERDRSFPIHAS